MVNGEWVPLKNFVITNYQLLITFLVLLTISFQNDIILEYSQLKAEPYC
jgi:hypothetical protein